ncbi:MAG TPA: hypothetical protein VJ577_04760, partial [Burkholderiaceae bacterium]|nr:hypothetical protein [Burkholderiaceae bacterium]
MAAEAASERRCRGRLRAKPIQRQLPGLLFFLFDIRSCSLPAGVTIDRSFVSLPSAAMSAIDLAKLVFLAAIWGGSFIFLR